MTQTAIVTGSSRGIGAATAKLLAKNGFAVVVNYRSDVAAAQMVVNQISELGGKAIHVRADISNEAEVQNLFQIAKSEYGQITALINNAGILETQSSLIDIDYERFKAILNVNVLGTFLCCREAIKYMPQNSGASIVNVSSIASQTGSPKEYIDYAASKGAVDSMTIGLAKEIASMGIRVNAVRPGMIKTDIHASGGEADRVARLASAIPLGRGGEALEVAQAIYWLISEESSYCTGTLLDIAGGIK